MKAVEPSSGTGVLGSFHVSEAASEPFSYFVVDDVFEHARADSLLAWLESRSSWKRIRSGFYDQYEFPVGVEKLRKDMPEECKPLFAQAAFAELAALVSKHLGIGRCVPCNLTAHKLVPGQGIGIHSDDDGDGPPQHRFVVHLNHSYDDQNGGHLGLFDGLDLDRVICIVRPLHNTGCAFSIGGTSQHAVSEIRRGNRYTLVYAFTG